MTIDDDLDPKDRALVRSLEARRPVPRTAFRGALGRRLAAIDPGYGPRPERLWLSAALLVAAGTLLLVVAVLFSTGAL